VTTQIPNFSTEVVLFSQTFVKLPSIFPGFQKSGNRVISKCISDMHKRLDNICRQERCQKLMIIEKPIRWLGMNGTFSTSVKITVWLESCLVRKSRELPHRKFHQKHERSSRQKSHASKLAKTRKNLQRRLATTTRLK